MGHQSLPSRDKTILNLTKYLLMMRKAYLVGLMLLCICHVMGQTYTQYRNCFEIQRSSQMDFTSFVLLTGCPQTNEYQEVTGVDNPANVITEKKMRLLGTSCIFLSNRELCNFRVGFVG